MLGRTHIASPWKGVLLCLTLAGFSACNKQEGLQPLDHLVIPPLVNSGVQVNFCTDPAQTVKSKLKYVVVLDHSGSNQINYQMDPNSGAPLNGVLNISSSYGTDPHRTSRYGDVNTPGTLLNFLANTPANDPSDPSVFFSLFYFSGSFTQYPTNNTFDSDVSDFYNKVLWVKQNTSDQGSTNYLDTLNGVEGLIANDIGQADACAKMSVGSAPTASCPTPGKIVSSSYVIVFMSDGAPITSVSVNPLSITRQPSNEILGAVAGIMGLQSNSKYVDGINLFTIYYYQSNPLNQDLTAMKLLQDMATVGNGEFYNVTSGSNIDYRAFTPPSRLIKYSLADVFVSNASAVVGSDGQTHLDTDMDGIADDQEASLGSNPKLADSDGNGVSDMVEMSANNGQPCGHKDASGKCVNGSGTVNYRGGICSGVSSQVVSGSVVFVSSDPDGLNDCEKIVLNDRGGINDPDSNGDLVPDFLEFKNGVPFQLGTASVKDTLDADGVSYYEKIKDSLPPLIPYYMLTNPHPAQYDLKILSSTPTQDCYQLAVSQLPMAGDNNTVRVDVVLRSPLLQDRFLYRIGKKPFQGSSQTIVINDWNDPGETAAGTWKLWP